MDDQRNKRVALKIAGDMGRSIIDLDVDKLIIKLNKAYADEWLAYYQYWIGAKIVKGRMRNFVESELLEHAKDELRHAEMLADRIVQLGGTPLLCFQSIIKQSECGFLVPKSPNTIVLLDQNIKSEQCAIMVYKGLLDYVRGKDDITFEIVREILADEVEHEEDLQSIQEDLG